MVSRDPNIPVESKAFDNCLSWTKIKTPFLPFTSKWEGAMRTRQRLINAGWKKIVIVAIWAKGMRNIYDAYEVAETLGYQNDGKDWRRQLRNHYNEYLVLGGISADEYRLLAVFDGHKEQKVMLSVPGLESSTTIPDAFMIAASGKTAQEKLENMIYMYTGIRGESEQLWYLMGFMIKAFDCPWTSFMVLR